MQRCRGVEKCGMAYVEALNMTSKSCTEDGARR